MKSQKLGPQEDLHLTWQVAGGSRSKSSHVDTGLINPFLVILGEFDFTNEITFWEHPLVHQFVFMNAR
jgi:hypothetical protein